MPVVSQLLAQAVDQSAYKDKVSHSGLSKDVRGMDKEDVVHIQSGILLNH